MVRMSVPFPAACTHSTCVHLRWKERERERERENKTTTTTTKKAPSRLEITPYSRALPFLSSSFLFFFLPLLPFSPIRGKMCTNPDITSGLLSVGHTTLHKAIIIFASDAGKINCRINFARVYFSFELRAYDR